MGTECPYLLLENWPGRLLKGDKVSCKRWTFRQVIGAIIFIRQPHTGSVHFAPLRLWVYPGRQFKAVWMGNGTAHLLEAGTFLPTWFPPTVKTHTQAHRSLQENGSPVISGHNWPSFLQPQIHSQRAHNWTKAECLWLTQGTTKDWCQEAPLLWWYFFESLDISWRKHISKSVSVYLQVNGRVKKATQERINPGDRNQYLYTHQGQQEHHIHRKG